MQSSLIILPGLVFSILLISLVFCQTSQAGGKQESANDFSQGTDKHKVLLLLLFDDNSKQFIAQVRPLLLELKDVYGARLELAELCLSPKLSKESLSRAKELGVIEFVEGATSCIPCVGVFTPQKKLVKELSGVKRKNVYARFIDKAMGAGK